MSRPLRENSDNRYVDNFLLQSECKLESDERWVHETDYSLCHYGTILWTEILCKWRLWKGRAESGTLVLFDKILRDVS
jgi:hypothetical protein